MTTYPDRQVAQFAATIKKMRRDLTVAQTQLNNAKTDIANLKALVNTLYTRIGDPSKGGTNGLTQVQSVFLATIEQMTTPGTYPLSIDTSSGPNWASGERTFVNEGINLDNLLVQKLQRSGLMHT